MKWTLIRGKKPSAIAAAVPTVIAFVAVMTVLVTVGVILTSTGYIFAAMRQKSRRKNALSNRYMLPEDYIDFRSHSARSKTTTREFKKAGMSDIGDFLVKRIASLVLHEDGRTASNAVARVIQ